ncbi:MAG: hypothetical protein Q9214_005461, partial [Letrouitia sp. 1 TL-2023]
MHISSVLTALAFVSAVLSYPAEQDTAAETAQANAPSGPARPRPLVEGDCIKNDFALLRLSKELSPQSAISCLGSPLQQNNAHRYWGIQFGKNASVVVYPALTRDVSLAVQAANASPKGKDFAFVCGAHSMINASTA